MLELLAPETDLPALEAALHDEPALIVDGLFGIGLNRPLAEPWQKIFAAINAAKIPVLAVDIPSGLNADTGETFGAGIKAAVTLTVGAPKRGLLKSSAWNPALIPRHLPIPGYLPTPRSIDSLVDSRDFSLSINAVTGRALVLKKVQAGPGRCWRGYRTG